YSDPADGNSDAVIALDMSTGIRKWQTQTLPGDTGNLACPYDAISKGVTKSPDPNCPRKIGPELDFTAPPILLRGGAGDVLVAGQKSGVAFGLNPDSGKILWKTQVSRGPE